MGNIKILNTKGKHRLGNRGSTFITTLAAITFLIVLGSVMIAVSTANLQIKQVEYRTKKNFYSDEQVLDDIYNAIGKTSSECLAGAYAQILSQVTAPDGTAVYKTENEAFEAFSNEFIKRMKTVYPDDASTLAKLNGYSIHSPASAKVEKYDRIEVLPLSSTPEQFIFRKLTVTYKEFDRLGTETGYQSTITTDIVVDVPYINFFDDPSRIFDYALIGNQGVYFRDGIRTVEGNIYAGFADSTLDPNSATNKMRYRNVDVYGGLNLYNSNLDYKGNYLISGGDINVRNSTLNILGPDGSAGKAKVWAESLRTVEDADRNSPEEPSKLDIDADLYMANDLELNARKSQVTLKGAYYGYNNNTYETKEKKTLQPSYMDSPVHTQSSSIVINGNNSQLDLSALNTFVVAGVAYVDMRSQNFPNEYATGESLALRTNQYLYLAPPQLLKVINPVETSGALPPADAWHQDNTWFGNEFINQAMPVVTKVFSNAGKSYTYYYLNFIDSESREKYASIVLNMVEPSEMAAKIPANIIGYYSSFGEVQKAQIWALKQEIANKARAAAKNDSAVPQERFPIIAADDTVAKIYTRGAVSRISGSGNDVLSAPVPDSSSRLSADYVARVVNNLFKHYKHLCRNLDPKEQFPLLSDSLSDPPEAAPEQPVSEFVNMLDLKTNGSGTEYQCNSSYKTILSAGNLSLTASVCGIVLCKGDVIITDNVKVEGMVIAAGSIYVSGNGSVTANRSVVQAILDEERKEEAKNTSGARNPAFATTYLKEFNMEPPDLEKPDRVTGTEYTDYISYQNWRKGDVN